MTEHRDRKNTWASYAGRDKFPCYADGAHCTLRKPGCQDHCERMKDAQAEKRRRKAIEREKRAIDIGVSEVKHNGYLAIKRQKPKER